MSGEWQGLLTMVSVGPVLVSTSMVVPTSVVVLATATVMVVVGDEVHGGG